MGAARRTPFVLGLVVAAGAGFLAGWLLRPGPAERIVEWRDRPAPPA